MHGTSDTMRTVDEANPPAETHGPVSHPLIVPASSVQSTVEHSAAHVSQLSVQVAVGLVEVRVTLAGRAWIDASRRIATETVISKRANRYL